MQKLKIEKGTSFGNWIVASDETRVINNVTNWVCQCSCGWEQFVPLNNLMNGSSTKCRRCGSIEGGKKRRKGFEDISGDYWSQIINKARNQKKSFSIRIEDAWDLYIKQEKVCAISGFDIKFSGYPHNSEETNAVLSLINIDDDYTLDNVQWVDKKVNKIKKNFNNNDLFYITNRIVQHQGRLQLKTYNENYKKY